MKALSVFDCSSQMYFKKVQHYRVDVIAGGASAAAYRYYKKQTYQDLYNSSVAVMLREMQSEVKTRFPCESRLHIEYCHNIHFPSFAQPAISIVT